MKLEYEYLRELLIEVEISINSPRDGITIEANDDFRRWYHFNQLIEAGYVIGRDQSSIGAKRYFIQDLTYEGHQILNKMRNDTVWQIAKDKAANIGGTVPIRIMEKLLDFAWDTLVP